MKYFAVIVVAVSAVVAQGAIPSGISSACSTFLNTLNTDSTLATCTSSIVSATSAFQSASSSSNSSVSSTLDNLCSSSSSCDSTYVRSLLSQFYSACQTDLSANDEVKQIYDLLYVFVPFRQAACTKDTTSNAYCATTLTSAASTSASKRSIALENRAAKNATTKAASSNSTASASTTPSAAPVTVDGSQLQSSGAPYLFLTPSTDKSVICTPCGKSVLQSYVSFEAQLNYATGISQSPILGGQSALWSHVDSVCGKDFISSVTSNAQGADPLGGVATGAAAVGVTKNSVNAIVLLAGAVAAMML